MLSGFKKFILRGNVVDMAVGVVIGAAFAGVVGTLTKGLLTPLIAAIVKAPDFSGLFFTLNGSKFLYGEFINATISFVLTGGLGLFLRRNSGQCTGRAHAQRPRSRRSRPPRSVPNA
jgi:large conductance mechanosensitive channel